MLELMGKKAPEIGVDIIIISIDISSTLWNQSQFEVRQ
jgi:hypothetical protein